MNDLDNNLTSEKERNIEDLCNSLNSLEVYKYFNILIN